MVTNEQKQELSKCLQVNGMGAPCVVLAAENERLRNRYAFFETVSKWRLDALKRQVQIERVLEQAEGYDERAEEEPIWPVG